MADDADEPIDLLTVRRQREAAKRGEQPNFLDVSTSPIMAFLAAPQLPRGPRLVGKGEVWFTMSPLPERTLFSLTTPPSLWQACPAAPPPRPRPKLVLV